MHKPIRWILALAMLVLAIPATTTAQSNKLSITIQPQSAQPGSIVTIDGRGAPPNSSVDILYAPFDDLNDCRSGRDADVAASVTARTDGSFLATHQANRLSESHAGYTYLAQLNQGPVPRPNSNLQCFTFGAQSQSRFFPETAHTVGGRFLEYWQNNGGLAVFGYPLTDEQQENGRTVQYFERQRFEYVPDNQAPYDVLLGRLGDEILAARGVDWREQPTSPGQAAGCYYFETTQHNVCNQQPPGVGFLDYWINHGLEFDGQPGSSFNESLALFGLPITEPYDYTNSSGDTVQTQWFERARFEWHPDNPAGHQVLLGRLGSELLDVRTGPTDPGAPIFDRVQVFLIALGDQGQNGQPVGCDDSLVPVEQVIEPTTAPLTAALERLLSFNEQYYGQSGLYNALYRSDLRLERATVANDQATITLSGDLQLGGVCDNPRIKGQIEATARQFSTVSNVVVYLNGQRLDDILSGR